jgi:SAM-dependent methyltransferase
MAVLAQIDETHFSGFARKAHGAVTPALHDRDGMYSGNDHHYLTCGASALNVISSSVEIAGTTPAKILDFGAGAGRVTRWLRAAFPKASIWATDIRKDDLAFCKKAFSVETFPSGIDVAALVAPTTYDLIWVGSVLTHLSEDTSEALTRKLVSWLNPGGILVMSLHGRFALARAPQFGYYGLTSGWDKLMADLVSRGFGYADYPNQVGYGISMNTLAWASRLVEKIDGARLILLSERAWDGHHDVVALQMRPVGEGL